MLKLGKRDNNKRGGKIVSRCKSIHRPVITLLLVLASGIASAATVNLSSPEWLGNLKLDKGQLRAIKKAVTKALEAPIDQEIQCAKVRGDCVVRAAREWTYQGDRFREIVIYLHTKGHASHTVAQTGGRWPAIRTGLEPRKKSSARKAKKKSKKKAKKK